MAYTGRFDGLDGEKAKITDQRGSWWGYLGRGVDAASIQIGATVEFEVEKVPPKDPTKKPYNRFTKITAIGQGAPPSMRPVAAAAPRVASAAPTGASNYAPANDTKDEQIYICGITNQYVANTGDTGLHSLVEVGLRAREAFQVVFRGKPFTGPRGGDDVTNSAPFNDDTPF